MVVPGTSIALRISTIRVFLLVAVVFAFVVLAVVPIMAILWLFIFVVIAPVFIFGDPFVVAFRLIILAFRTLLWSPDILAIRRSSCSKPTCRVTAMGHNFDLFSRQKAQLEDADLAGDLQSVRAWSQSNVGLLLSIGADQGGHASDLGVVELGESVANLDLI